MRAMILWASAWGWQKQLPSHPSSPSHSSSASLAEKVRSRPLPRASPSVEAPDSELGLSARLCLTMSETVLFLFGLAPSRSGTRGERSSADSMESIFIVSVFGATWFYFITCALLILLLSLFKCPLQADDNYHIFS